MFRTAVEKLLRAAELQRAGEGGEEKGRIENQVGEDALNGSQSINQSTNIDN